MKKIIAFALAMIMAVSLGIGASARLVGDVNSDKVTNSSDALLILQYIVGSQKTINEKYADVNGDGKVNSTDALEVLKICVGLYTGELEINDEVVTLKSKYIDPIISSKKFTLTTTVEQDGEKIPVTIMVDGNNMATQMTYSGMTLRVVILNGQAYCVMPKFLLGQDVYGKLVGGEDMLDFGDFGTSAELEFVKSEKVTISGKTYTKETFKVAGSNEYSYTENVYYFLGNEWKILETVTHTSTVKNGERVWVEQSETQTIDTFKSGVDSSYFKLSGMNIGDIDMGDLA